MILEPKVEELSIKIISKVMPGGYNLYPILRGIGKSMMKLEMFLKLVRNKRGCLILHF